MESKVEIPLSGSSLTIVKKCGRALGDVIHSKFGCVATFDGVDFESDRSIAQKKKPTVVPQKIFSDTLNNGIEVSVWKADLTTLQVDAVVNAANTRLDHCGGLALALSEAGGVQIQQDSNAYIRKHKELETGKAIIADAWSLPCNKIIHAVGPQLSRFNPNVGGAEPLLKKTIKSILDIVRENRLDTVAIPAISSGIFNYPLNKCAETIVSTVKQYYDYNSTRGHRPKEIQLVNNDEPTVRAMEKACRQILQSPMTMSYSQAAGSRSTGAAKATRAVRIGNVTLTLKKGKIEEQQTDVIVNTVSPSRKLNTGEISKAVLLKAGSQMQKEINMASSHNDVITTNSCKLPCKEVYHTCCADYGKDAVKQSLHRLVLECLWRATASQYKSISFPAIGTGGLSLRTEEAARIMSEAVADFAQNTPKMMDVYFVIYSSDGKFEAFEEQIQCLHQKVSSPSVTPAFQHKHDFRDTKPSSPQISLIARSDEATCEAKRWLTGLLFKPSGTVYIYNNFIQHYGEEEYQQLSRLTQNSVSIEESFVNGHACITVMGNSHEDVVVAGLQVEAMLLNIQMKFATEEEDTMLNALGKLATFNFERRTVNHTAPIFSDISLHSKHHVLHLVKAENVDNPALEMMFNLKKKQLNTSPQRMFQRIPAQFCEMVCRTGFHVEYAPPEDPAYGEGIYFASSVKAAMELWKYQNEEYVYLVEADVLTGVSTRGEPGLILPPAQGADPSIRYDSVTGGTNIAVVFSTYQARPKHIFTCKLVKSDSSTVSSML